MRHSSTVAAPAAPAASGTAVLFNSVTAFGGAKLCRPLDLSMIEVNYLRLSHASAANGLKIYASSDGGTNWRQLSMPDSDGVATMPVTVSAVAADSNTNYKFDVSGFDDIKLEHTNSNNTLTTWEPVITLHFGAEAVQR